MPVPNRISVELGLDGEIVLRVSNDPNGVDASIEVTVVMSPAEAALIAARLDDVAKIERNRRTIGHTLRHPRRKNP